MTSFRSKAHWYFIGVYIINENHIGVPRSEEVNEGDMIILHLILHSEVHIYDFHIF